MKRMEIIENPNKDTIVDIFKEARINKHILILVGRFSIDYRGRASSHIETGDRILIFKEDGSLIIHRSKGYRPVNWQPTTNSIKFEEENGMLKIIFVRLKPRELVSILLEKTYVIIHGKFDDIAKFEMHLTEEDLKNILKTRPEYIEKGLRITREEHDIEIGKIDLLGRDKNGNLVVIELKKGRIGDQEVLQLNRYVQYFRKTNSKVRGIIVGSSITSSAKILLENLKLEFKKVDIKKLASELHKI